MASAATSGTTATDLFVAFARNDEPTTIMEMEIPRTILPVVNGSIPKNRQVERRTYVMEFGAGTTPQDRPTSSPESQRTIIRAMAVCSEMS